MANPEHLAKLREGIQVWNQWRKENLAAGDVDLRGVILDRGERLVMADLRGADLRGSTLRDVPLVLANLSKADLSEADFGGANFTKAELSGAKLRETDLGGANFAKAKLCGADLRRAKLVMADLSEADLSGANLSGANLGGANLQRANLTKADLMKSDITAAQLQEARGFEFPNNADTILREIEFPAALKDSGIAILNYFGTYLNDKYPGQHVAVRIQQQDLKVRMEVDPPEGEKHTIEEELREYGLVVVGEKAPAEVLRDPYQIAKLENQLELTRTQLQMNQRLFDLQEKVAGQFAAIAEAAVGRKKELDDTIRKALVALPPNASSSVVTHVHAGAEASAEVSVKATIDSQTPELLEELRERLEDPDARAEAAERVARLSSQARLPEPRRKPREELASDWNALEKLAQTAGIVGSATSVWQTWGATISKVLGF